MNRGSGSKSYVSVTIGRGHRQILMWLSSFNHKYRCLYYVACDSVEDVLAGGWLAFTFTQQSIRGSSHKSRGKYTTINIPLCTQYLTLTNIKIR
jgi:hypothetical protein